MMHDKKKANGEDPDAGNALKRKSKISTLRAQLKSDYLGTADGYDDPFNLDEGNVSKKKKKEDLEFEGIGEEIDFEEVFDDDEVSELRGEEDEERADVSKYKKPAVDEEDDDVSNPVLNSAGKALKKTLKHLDKGNLYESDEELDPYAGSDDQEGSTSTSLSEDEEEHAQGGKKGSHRKSQQQQQSSQEDMLLSPLALPSSTSGSFLAPPKEHASPKVAMSKPISQPAAKGPKSSIVSAPMAKKVSYLP